MPPKINTNTYIKAKKVFLLNRNNFSNQKMFSYNQDLEMQLLKKYLDRRISNKKKAPIKKSTKKPNLSRKLPSNCPLTQLPIQQQQQYLQNDDQNLNQERQIESLTSLTDKKRKKPKVFHRENIKKIKNQTQNQFSQDKNQLSHSPNQSKEKPRELTYEEEIRNLVLNRGSLRRISDLSTQEHQIVLNSVIESLNHVRFNTDAPPYYQRMVQCSENQIAQLNKDKEELADLMFKQKRICPILFPLPGKLTEKDKKNMVQQFEYKERCRQQKKSNQRGLDHGKVSYKHRKFDQCDNSFVIRSFEEQSSKYVTETVIHKLRHKKDLPKYYEDGFRRIYTEIPNGLPPEAFESLEAFNAANFQSFSTLDANYYRSMDQRNAGFCGYLQTDEPYADDMPFQHLFPELVDMFRFPKRQDSFLDDPNDSEQSQNNQKKQQKQETNPLNNNCLNLREEDLNRHQRKQIYSPDDAPMQKQDLNRIKERIVNQFQKYIKINQNIPFYNKYTQQQTNRWDYYVSDERFLSDEDEKQGTFIDESMNYSRTHTLPLPIPSKTKTLQFRPKTHKQPTPKNNLQIGTNDNIQVRNAHNIQPGIKANKAQPKSSFQTDKKERQFSQTQNKSEFHQHETKSKLRKTNEKVNYNQIDVSESDQEDFSDYK